VYIPLDMFPLFTQTTQANGGHALAEHYQNIFYFTNDLGSILYDVVIGAVL
jgi:hypothetical protein